METSDIVKRDIAIETMAMIIADNYRGLQTASNAKEMKYYEDRRELLRGERIRMYHGDTAIIHKILTEYTRELLARNMSHE